MPHMYGKQSIYYELRSPFGKEEPSYHYGCPTVILNTKLYFSAMVVITTDYLLSGWVVQRVQGVAEQ